jgi:hypothetical protein
MPMILYLVIINILARIDLLLCAHAVCRRRKARDLLHFRGRLADDQHRRDVLYRLLRPRKAGAHFRDRLCARGSRIAGVAGSRHC